MIPLPKHRPPTSPGRLLERFLIDHELTQTRLAQLAGMQLRRVNEILKTKRAVTPDTALRLARFFNTTPDLWINAQTAWDLWHAREQAGAEIEAQVIPLVEASKARSSSPTEQRAAAGRGAGAAPLGSVWEFATSAQAPRLKFSHSLTPRVAKSAASSRSSRSRSGSKNLSPPGKKK